MLIRNISELDLRNLHHSLDPVVLEPIISVSVSHIESDGPSEKPTYRSD